MPNRVEAPEIINLWYDVPNLEKCKAVHISPVYEDKK